MAGTFLRRLLSDPQSDVGRRFALLTGFLIVVSIIGSSLETLPNLSPTQRIWLERLEFFIVIIFTVEYLMRLGVADDRLKFATSFFGIIDLLAILPFYLALGIDLRSVRGFRLLRLFRILKLTRYNRAVRRFHIAFLIAREEIVLFLCVTVILLYLTAFGIYYFEHDAQPDKFASVFDSLWWAVVTLTTVGYGDVYPITLGGRVFTGFVLLIGLGVVAMPTGLVASALSKAREIEAKCGGDSKDVKQLAGMAESDVS